MHIAHYIGPRLAAAILACILGCGWGGCATPPPPSASPPPARRGNQPLAAQESLRRAANQDYGLRRYAAAETAMHARQYAEVIRLCQSITREVGDSPQSADLLKRTRRLLAEGYYGEARRLRAADFKLEALSNARMAELMGHPRATRLVGKLVGEVGNR